MGGDEAVSAAVAIGIGCRRGCEAAAIVALVREALTHAPVELAGARLVTIEAKRDEAGIAQAARDLGLPVAYLSQEELARAAGRAVTRSARVEALLGLPSLAETAALAGAGPEATLVVPRLTGGGASCAVACAPSQVGASL
jgi:cobalt-precorrin 5A hydrolase